MRRRQRVLLGVVLAAALVAAGGLGASLLIESPAERAARTAAPPPSVLTVPVESRKVTDTLVMRGQVAAAQTVTVSPQSAGGSGDGAALAVVTAVRVKVGTSVAAGQVLAEVAGRPVFVLPGALPVYRDLKPGSSGRDVKQLQTALRSLGLARGLVADGDFGSATKDAVVRLYDRLGYDAPLAGGSANEELKAAEQAVRQAQRAYEQARDAVDNADAGGSAAAQATGEAAGGSGGSTASAEQQLRYAREDRDQAREELSAVRSRTGPMVPASEVVFLSSIPARVDSVNATVGGQVEDDMLVLSSGQLVVTARLRPDEQGLVTAGQAVTITSEVLGVEAAGRVETVATSPQNEQADNGETTTFFPMRVTSTKPLDPRLAGQGVRLTVVAASTRSAVLAVPEAAVSSQADGTTAVVRRLPGGRQERVVVTVGTSGDGYVEVKPTRGALRAGDLVVVGR